MKIEDGMEIKPFAESRLFSNTSASIPFLKGSAFYQLTKTEARVQDSKMIAIRDKINGRVYHGPAARDMIGLPHIGTVRLHPGDHGNYDIFIQSTSINRKLVAGTQVLYWPKVGQGFTEADFPWLKTAQANTNPALVQSAMQSINSTNPTNQQFYDSRKLAREGADLSGKKVKDNGKAAGNKRWSVQ